jgi:hypothetical protein
MAADETQDKVVERRHVWGPRAVGALVPGLIRPVFKRKSAASAQVMTDWPLIIGPALAAVTAPRRLSGSTLTIACAGPVAMELQHMTAEILSRINGHLGQVVVERLRFVQDTLIVATPVAPIAHPLPPPVITGLPEGPLHEALVRLGQAVQSAAKRPITKP